MLDPQKAKSFWLLNAGAIPPKSPEAYEYDVVTSLTGRAFADMLSPGIDSKW
jgi:hypothetical protein